MKLEPQTDRPVLSYHPVDEPVSLTQRVRNVYDTVMDCFTASSWLLFVISGVFVSLSLVLRGIGIVLFLGACVIWWVLIDRWSKSSRFF